MAPQKVRNWCAARTPAERFGGATAHPTFQPVRLKVLPKLESVTVRSRIPGSVAIESGRSPYQISSYTSSASTRQSAARATRATASSSARSSTRPVGLCGVLMTIIRVRGPTARASASTGNRKSGADRRTVRTVPPASATHAG